MIFFQTKPPLEIMTFPFHDLPSFFLKKSPGLKAGNVAVSCPGQNLTSMHQIQVGSLRVAKHNRPKNPWTLQWKGLNLYNKGIRVLKIAIFEGSGFLGRDLCETWLFSLKKISDSFKTSETCGDFCKKNTAQVFAKLLLTLSSMCHPWLHRLAGLKCRFFCKRETFHR